MKTSVLSLVALAAAIALGWLVLHLVDDRRVFLEGPVVIGAVSGFENVESRSRNKSTGRRSTRVTRYPIVSYQIPQQWPELAGHTLTTQFSAVDPQSEKLALGAEVQLRLSARDPREARVNSLLGMWGVPLAVLFFGSALLLVPTLMVPAPTPEKAQSKRKQEREARKSPVVSSRAQIVGLVILVVFAGFFFFPVLLPLVLGPLFLLICALIVGSAVFAFLRRLGRLLLLQKADPQHDRPGVLGLLIDLQQSVLLTIVIGAFLVLSVVASFVGIERLFPQQAWALAPVNTVRSLFYLPQDFDMALCQAAAVGDTDGSQWLASHGARPEVFCGNGVAMPDVAATAGASVPPARLSQSLLAAAREGNLTMVKALLAKGADPDLVVKGADPVLLFAIRNKEDALIKLLLEGGADPNLQISGGRTITDELADLDRSDKAREYLPLLAQHGADLNHLDAEGRTLLMRECADPNYSSHEFIELLLELGADPNLAGPDGRTALDLAQADGYQNGTALLQARNARSGRVSKGPGVQALGKDAPPAVAALAQLQRMRAGSVKEWKPAYHALGFTESEAGDFKDKLPESELVVTGYSSADRASVDLCGFGAHARVCVGMELRLELVQSKAESPASNDPGARDWRVLSYWQNQLEEMRLNSL